MPTGISKILNLNLSLMMNKDFHMNKLLIVSLTLLLTACGGSGDSGSPQPAQNVPTNTTPTQPATFPTTASTTAAADHSFAMFSEQDLSVMNTSQNLVTLLLTDENDNQLLQTALRPSQTKSFRIQIPAGNDTISILWSGKNSEDDTYASEQRVVDITQPIVFNGFNQ